MLVFCRAFKFDVWNNWQSRPKFVVQRALEPNADVDNDGTVNMRDIQYSVIRFSTKPVSPTWDPYADLNDDGTVNMRDIQIQILNFNKHE